MPDEPWFGIRIVWYWDFRDPDREHGPLDAACPVGGCERCEGGARVFRPGTGVACVWGEVILCEGDVLL